MRRSFSSRFLNPWAALILIGLTFGTYKEQVDSGVADPFRPSLAHIAAIIGALPK